MRDCKRCEMLRAAIPADGVEGYIQKSTTQLEVTLSPAGMDFIKSALIHYMIEGHKFWEHANA